MPPLIKCALVSLAALAVQAGAHAQANAVDEKFEQLGCLHRYQQCAVWVSTDADVERLNELLERSMVVGYFEAGNRGVRLTLYKSPQPLPHQYVLVDDDRTEQVALNELLSAGHTIAHVARIDPKGERSLVVMNRPNERAFRELNGLD